MANSLKCRPYCGACCIAPSISSPISNMQNGKPAGIPCPQLDENFNCRLFLHPSRPAVCCNLKASYEMCGSSREHAIIYLTNLERLTQISH